MFSPTDTIMHHHQSLSYANGVDDDAGGHYIEHQISQYDTLAGLAIKYGVEVADIKRMNGLATDLQMYALKSVQIPSLRRHPPAPSQSNGSPSPGESSNNNSSRRPPHLRRHSYSFESLLKSSPQQKASPAMSSLQNYYGLKPPSLKCLAEGTEMANYKSNIFSENGGTIKSNHKSILMSENGGVMEDVPITDVKDGDGGDRSAEKSVRRRQKADIDHSSGGGGGFFSALSGGKGLSLRPKSSSRLSTDAESSSGWFSSTLSALRDPLATTSDGIGSISSRVHKSLSTSCLQDQMESSNNNYNSSSAWLTTKWSLKPDLQALSAVASSSIARPIFDGLPLPKPVTSRKNKAALD